jgi:predicted translin family RNA/ssDNA-binding protein
VMDTTGCSDHDRIVKLETHREADQHALELARELVLAEHRTFKEMTEKHFESTNGMQQRLDKYVEKLATKDDLNTVAKVAYTATAILTILQAYLWFHLAKG